MKEYNPIMGTEIIKYIIIVLTSFLAAYWWLYNLGLIILIPITQTLSVPYLFISHTVAAIITWYFMLKLKYGRITARLVGLLFILVSSVGFLISSAWGYSPLESFRANPGLAIGMIVYIPILGIALIVSSFFFKKNAKTNNQSKK